ncbi:MAG: hypothetical protein N2554_09505 [Fimbriimonadales bacterium]|nr:hypothetical protein [Fimbriimonadales bacterium]
MGTFAMGCVIGFAQPVATPPARLGNWLPEPSSTFPRYLEIRVSAFADTNVRPLFQKPAEPAFAAERAYFRQAFAYSLHIRLPRWEFSVAYGQADRYEGNQGAARLFLEAEQKQITSDSSYPVEATLNRSALQSWGATYHGEWNSAHAKVRYQVGIRYLNLQRVQQGWLQGQKEGDSFEGELLLLTTRGLPAETVGGAGFTLDAGVAVETEGWVAGVFVENLWSRLRTRQVQQIEANLRINRPVPDADGFLRAPPALEGRIRYPALQRAARPRTTIEVWRATPSNSVGVLAQRADEWQAALAFRGMRGQSRFCLTYWQPRPSVWLTFEQNNWSITAGADFWNGDALHRFALELSWRFPLK